MKKETKDFILDLRDRMLLSNIKDACLNFMKLHPYMFSESYYGGKIMSINMSVCICAKDEEGIATDPGFITISLDNNNTYSEHFKTTGNNSVYWNNEEEEESND